MARDLNVSLVLQAVYRGAAAVGQAVSGLGRVGRATDETAEKTRQLDRAQEEAAASARTLERAQLGAGRSALLSAEKAQYVRRYARDARDAADATDRLTASQRNAASAADRLGDSARKAGRELRQLGEQGNLVDQLTTRFLKLQVAIEAAQAAARYGSAAIAAAANYDYDLAKVGIVAGLDEAGKTELRQLLERTAKETNFAEPELLQTYKLIVGKGLKGPQAAEMLKTIAVAAKGGDAVIADVAAVAVALINNVDIPADKIGIELDRVLASSNDGAVEPKNMARLLPELLPAIASTQISGSTALATALAALQTLEPAAGSPDQANTNLINVINKVFSPEFAGNVRQNLGKDAAKYFERARKERGLNAFDAMLDLVQNFKSKAKSPEEAEKNLGLLFQDFQALAGIRTLLKKRADYERRRADLLSSDVEGTAEKQAAVLLATPREALDEAARAAERAQRQAGEAALPTAAEIARGVTPNRPSAGETPVLLYDELGNPIGIEAPAGQAGGLTSPIGPQRPARLDPVGAGSDPLGNLISGELVIRFENVPSGVQIEDRIRTLPGVELSVERGSAGLPR